MASTALNFAVQTIAARGLGATGYGTYSYSINAAQLLAVPSDLGQSNGVMRLIPQYRAEGRDGVARKLVLQSQLATFSMGCFLAAVGVFLSSAVGGGPVPRVVLVTALVCVPLFALSLVQMNILRSLGGILSALLPSLVLQPALVLLCLFLLRNHTSALDVVGLTALGLALTVAVHMALIYRATARLVTSAQRSRRAIRLKGWFRLSLPLLLINLTQLVFQRVDIVLVGVLIDARSAGIYALASRIAGFTSLMANSYANMIAPQLSSAHWSGRPDQVTVLASHALRVTILPAAVAVGVFTAFGPQVLHIFGPDFGTGYVPLVVYAVGQMISVAFGPVGVVASMVGRERPLAWQTGVAAIITLVGYIVLIPWIGIVGAAAANAFGVTYRNFAAAALARRAGYRFSLSTFVKKG